ncbi:MAG: class I SAM-dependent DNA methyltransferase [Neisseriaceae bacterium]|nr:MAG: class I SAM-dependent DNA methyltransferase [Neisseriaceae bacterium]
MNITQIEQNVANLCDGEINQQTFIYDFLLAFGLAKASIARLQKGDKNLSKTAGEILWKKKLYFKPTATAELYQTIESIRSNPQLLKNDPRFVIVTDFQQLLALDTKTLDTLDIGFNELAKHFDFFLPWAGMEKATYQGENPADVKAAEKMAKLFDEIRKDNPEFTSKEQLHSLNVFLSRLLFCFFAEDTGIFAEKQFTNAIKSYTQSDGSDVHQYLDKIFALMNQKERANLPDYIAKFPYVNGGLFRDSYPVPKFSFKSRQLLLESGDLDWSVINPDIFGSMMQAVVDAKQRSGLGMHYTSVPNIMKVIEPLFLNELKEEFTKASESKAKLEKLLARIAKIKIFDPACGSGNFLIIAYKELRSLEISIMQRIDELTGKASMLFSQIQLHNFYGIEIDDFAHEIAKLSLWLAEHQMNMRFEKEFGRTLPPLPLKDSGNIVCANACRIDWEEICPKTPDDEIYILGNPPYLGARLQNESQKYDMSLIFDGINGYNNLDYIAAWFFKAGRYIETFKIKSAFVTTNSICQGEQVSLLWSHMFKFNIEISFAHLSFKWANNAKSNAGVTVAIIGLRNVSSESKYIFQDNSITQVKNINPYLLDAKNIYISKHSRPISSLSEMCFGSMANDAGNLFLTPQEYHDIIEKYPNTKPLIKKLLGSQEFIRGEKKYCLWITDELKDLAFSIPKIKQRIDKVHNVRLTSKRAATNVLADQPYKFGEIRHKKGNSIIIPSVSSERREYIPMGFLNEDTVIVAPNLAIYDPEPWIFGVISSKMHMAWVRAVAGRLETRIRYSSTLCYNTFPFPDISADQKKRIEMYVFEVLDEREKHSEKTLAELYDPDKMPDGLRQAHHNLDIAIEQCYRPKPFISDEERLEHLFTLYEQMASKSGK